MKLKVFTFILFSLFLTQITFSQKNVLKNVEFNINVGKTEWSKADKIITRLSVQNNSGKEIKLELSPDFYLVKEGINEKDLSDVGYHTYWSAAKMETPKGNGKIFGITAKVIGISDEDEKMFYPQLLLKKGEVKSVKMDLTRLAWGKSISSIFPSGSWFALIPKGNYKLYFAMRTGEKETFQYEEYTVTQDIKIESNRISVTLLDGKEN